MKYDAVCLSDPGQVRDVNEDSTFSDKSTGLFVLADGMGGHACGKEASELAIAIIDDYLNRWRKESGFAWPFDPNPEHSVLENHVATALRVANVRVYNEAQKKPELYGMGTTAVLLLVGESSVIIGHVGDSRCYTHTNGVLEQVTQDHSLVNQLMRAFDLSEEEAVAKAGKNVLVQSIGMDEDIFPQLVTITPRDTTTFLLCSDGLTDMLEEDVICQIIESHDSDLKLMGQTLISEANSAGGSDNISVILVQIQQ